MRRNLHWASVLTVGVATVFAYKTVRRILGNSAQAAHDDAMVNDALDASFPASDPPSYTPTSGSRV
jgi:hypothetical protein